MPNASSINYILVIDTEEDCSITLTRLAFSCLTFVFWLKKKNECAVSTFLGARKTPGRKLNVKFDVVNHPFFLPKRNKAWVTMNILKTALS